MITMAITCSYCLSSTAQISPLQEDIVSRCKNIVSHDFSGIADAPTKVLSSKLIHAKKGMPEHCLVEAYIAPSIGVELSLPKKWNGKFVEVGCGGHCGKIFAGSCDYPLQKNYACVASDMGHKSTWLDGQWAYNNVQAEIDWGYRATHVSALAGKAITEHFYHIEPERSYFMGCSTGGRQGLIEAQRFPWDFDGIVVGAPAMNLTSLYMQFVWNARAVQSESKNSLLNQDDLKLVNDAVLALCDMDDGVYDGVVGDPLQCKFDLSKLACPAEIDNSNCLNAEKIAAIEKIYSGVMTSEGKKLFTGGPVPGSELNWFGRINSLMNPFQNSLSIDETAGLEAFRYMMLMPDPGPEWEISDFDFDKDYKRLGLMESLYASSNPDLRKFKAAGGKMIVYQGWSDMSIPPRNIIDYYETVVKTLGGREHTDDFMRLFLLPGVNHCSGGKGADSVDYLAYLEKWVEQGTAPDRMEALHAKDADGIQFSRPLFPYPLKAKYSGYGNSNDAKNFVPVR